MVIPPKESLNTLKYCFEDSFQTIWPNLVVKEQKLDYQLRYNAKLERKFMNKLAEIADPNSCWNKAQNDEPVFVLLGRDFASLTAVLNWVVVRCKFKLNKFEDDQIQEALKWIEDTYIENERKFIHYVYQNTKADNSKIFCTCDLDKWQPDNLTGHVTTCPHHEAILKIRAILRRQYTNLHDTVMELVTRS